LFIPISGNVRADEFKNLPVKGTVTLIDLGAKKCIPCKMMAPILEKMEKVYKGKAAVVFTIKTVKKCIGMLGFWLKKILWHNWRRWVSSKSL